MSWNWFKLKSASCGRLIAPAVENPYEGFEVEFYPITGVYIAKYNKDMLWTKAERGTIETLPSYFRESHLSYCDKFSSQKDAWSFIDKFLEQRWKKNVVTYTR